MQIGRGAINSGTAIFTAIILSIVVSASFFQTKKDREATSWPSTTSSIVGYKNCDSPIRCGVRYIYFVENRKYIGSRVSFTTYHMPKGWNNDEINNWIKQSYPVGLEIDVYYDPNNPQDSSLQVGKSNVQFESNATWMSFIIFGCLTFLLITKIMRKKHNKSLKFVPAENSPPPDA